MEALTSQSSIPNEDLSNPKSPSKEGDMSKQTSISKDDNISKQSSVSKETKPDIDDYEDEVDESWLDEITEELLED